MLMALTPLQKMTFPDTAVKTLKNPGNMGIEIKNDMSLTSVSGEDSDIYDFRRMTVRSDGVLLTMLDNVLLLLLKYILTNISDTDILYMRYIGRRYIEQRILYENQKSDN